MTTVVEVTEVVPATSTVAEEEGAITIESALVPLYTVSE